MTRYITDTDICHQGERRSRSSPGRPAAPSRQRRPLPDPAPTPALPRHPDGVRDEAAGRAAAEFTALADHLTAYGHGPPQARVTRTPPPRPQTYVGGPATP